MEGAHLSLYAVPCGALLGLQLTGDALWPSRSAGTIGLSLKSFWLHPAGLRLRVASPCAHDSFVTPHTCPTLLCCALQAGVGNISVAIFGLAQASGSSIQNVAARAGAGQFSIGNPSGRRRLFTAGTALQPCDQATGADWPAHQLMLPQQSLPRGLGPPRFSQAGQARQLLQTCTQAVSAGVFGDINFDCQFIFVEVGFSFQVLPSKTAASHAGDAPPQCQSGTCPALKHPALCFTAASSVPAASCAGPMRTPHAFGRVYLLCTSLIAPIPLLLCLQDVVLLDSIYGTWDSGNPSNYYNNLEAGSVNAGPGGQPTQHQRQELDISYK